MNDKEKETDQIILRDVVKEDLGIFFEHQSDPEANRMAGFAPRDKDAFMAHWDRILADKNIIKKTVIFNGDAAGNIVSFVQAGQREIGYWIGREYWGRGIATRALIEFLSQVRTRPLYAHAAINNIASIRVLEKCGFRKIAEEEEEIVLFLE